MTSINGLLEASRAKNVARDCPFWPPDLFVICGTLLKLSGAYLGLFKQAKRTSRWKDSHRPGLAWRENIDKLHVVSVSSLKASVPVEVEREWKRIVRAKDINLGEIPDSPLVADALIRLTLIADAASAGIGVNKEDSPFLMAAQRCLEDNYLSSFCWEVDRHFAGVMGKQHTPQRGATFRSLTHHLSLYTPNDITAKWVGPYVRDRARHADAVNLLLLPWPLEVETDDFRLAKSERKGKGSTRYFEYSPAREETLPSFRRRLTNILSAAHRHAKHIDAVVFPELSLSVEQYFAAEELAIKYKTMLIAGVRTSSQFGQGGNFCIMQPAGLLFSPSESAQKYTRRKWANLLETVRLAQSKHHRWCLDRDQIYQYQLAGNIPAGGLVWENIHLLPRQLHFVTLGSWMTWSVLICEDLARQDPVADLIRSVAPNLLITLLMDGPQLSGRWPSRYASVLAEDPGTSVLTLTSLGMAERCRPTLRTTGRRAEKSRAIALWRDVEIGEQEIVLDAGDHACILSLSCSSREEMAADGRGDHTQAHWPIFAGYKSFRSDR